MNSFIRKFHRYSGKTEQDLKWTGLSKACLEVRNTMLSGITVVSMTHHFIFFKSESVLFLLQDNWV